MEGIGTCHAWAGSCTALGYIPGTRQYYPYCDLLCNRNSSLHIFKFPGIRRTTESYTYQPWWTISTKIILNIFMHPWSASFRSLHYPFKMKQPKVISSSNAPCEHSDVYNIGFTMCYVTLKAHEGILSGAFLVNSDISSNSSVKLFSSWNIALTTHSPPPLPLLPFSNKQQFCVPLLQMQVKSNCIAIGQHWKNIGIPRKQCCYSSNGFCLQ